MFSFKVLQNEIIRKKDLLKSFTSKEKYNFDFKKFSKFKKFKTVIIIGMGGSILGSKAIYTFFKHKIKKKFIFVDNLDQIFLRKIEKENKLNNALFVVISKSGNTIETLINASYFKKFFKTNNVIFLSENKKNVLRNFAKAKKFTFVNHNPNIGGRFSIFSDAGMLPVYLMGLNPLKFKKNLMSFFKNKKKAMKSLNHISKIDKKNLKVLILFSYVPELKDFLFWCQQLLAESLGKNKKGFMPVISEGPKDHHSLLQLYLDGPKDKIYYVFSSKISSKLKINCSYFGKETNFINRKKFSHVKESQKRAFVEVLKKNKIPYKEIILKKLDEETLGQLFFIFIMETLALSKIMNVNPYNQPAVEMVKIFTKKFLN